MATVDWMAKTRFRRAHQCVDKRAQSKTVQVTIHTCFRKDMNLWQRKKKKKKACKFYLWNNNQNPGEPTPLQLQERTLLGISAREHDSQKTWCPQGMMATQRSVASQIRHIFRLVPLPNEPERSDA